LRVKVRAEALGAAFFFMMRELALLRRGLNGQSAARLAKSASESVRGAALPFFVRPPSEAHFLVPAAQ